MEKEFDLEIVFTPAMLCRKKKSDELVSNNNLSKWWRQSKTKIMNNFKDTMKEWYLPISDDNPYRWAEIHFTILRTNNRKIDSDALGSSTYKWTIDLLVEQGYLLDDDQCRVVQNPTLLNCEGTIETSVRMQVNFYERFEMTIDKLRDKLLELNNELLNVGGKEHVKAASKRARIILGEIKNAVPQLRKTLIELDKK